MGFIKLQWQVARLGSADWSEVGFFTKVFRANEFAREPDTVMLWHREMDQRGECTCLCVSVCVWGLEDGRGSLVKETLPEKESLVQASREMTKAMLLLFLKSKWGLRNHRSVVLSGKKVNLRGETLPGILLCSKDSWNAYVDMPSEVLMYYFQIFLIITKFQLLLNVGINVGIWVS